MSAEQEGRTAASDFREKHNLGVQPIGDLATMVEQETGVDVAVLETGRNEHGLTVRDPVRGTTFIAVAKTRHAMRQRSSRAHEVAHVLFEDWTREPVTKRSHEEIRADAFARHLLLPQAGLQDLLGPPSHAEVNLSSLSEVVVRFLVSPVIAAIALEQGGYISTTSKEEWKRLATHQVASRFGWSDRYAMMQESADRVRAPRQLLARATRGYAEGVVSLETLASLRQVPVDAVRAELEEAGVHPALPREPWSSPDALPSVEIDLSDLEGGPDHGALE